MGYMSDNGSKSIMRVLVSIIVIVACLLGIFVITVWAYGAVVHLQGAMTASPIDIGQQTYLILGMLGIAITGKFVQKAFENGGIKTKSINMEYLDKEDGLSHK